MKHPLSEKLHSRRGASLLLALLFLLVGLTVGAVVLTAASANAGRAQRNLQEQQDYLAAASAMELAEADLQQAVLTGSYQKIVTEVYHPAVFDEEGNVVSASYVTTTTDYKLSGLTLTGSDLLTADTLDFQGVYRYYHTVDVLQGLRPEDPQQCTLAFAAAHGMPGVSGVLAVDASDTSARWAMTVQLWTQGEGEGDTRSNPMTLSLTPQLQQSSREETTHFGDTTVYTTTYTTQVTWGQSVITKGAEA